MIRAWLRRALTRRPRPTVADLDPNIAIRYGTP